MLHHSASPAGTQLDASAGATAVLDGSMPHAHQATARDLLVLGRRDLDAGIKSALRAGGWRLLHAKDTPAARSIVEQQEVHVGLAVFPESLSDAVWHELHHAVTSLQGLDWVAALDRRHLTRLDVRRLVVGRLRDYQTYPIDPVRLSYAVGHAWGIASLAHLHQGAECAGAEHFGLLGTSEPMRRLHKEIQRVAASGLPVLVSGETGTGKELVARALHGKSPRAKGPFVAVNCAAIPTSLVESELFGVAKGAFTGASTPNIGLIESAAGGTLLLDEIGEMPLESQASLLRFLEDKRVLRVGGRQSTEVNVAVIASTNRDLYEEVRQGRFRQDLLYRLDVVSIQTPPLRDRTSDIPTLAQHLLHSDAKELPRPLLGFTDKALGWLQVQPWPGNVRELRNCVIQAGLRCSGAYITEQDLAGSRLQAEAPGAPLEVVVNGAEKATLEQLLKRNRGNVSKTARDLQVSRMTLYRLMSKHGITRPLGETRATAGQ